MADFPERWGAYVLIRPLATGGMGSVYLALTRSGGVETLCVVKRLTAETLSDHGRRKRFSREGDISRALSFAGIARTLETGEYRGEPYLAQEYIEGRTIAQLCSAAASVGKRLSPLVIAYIGEKVAAALEYAHRLDVVHRDIAPRNVMIRFDGTVSLIDFGIARRSADPSLTSTGDFIGRAAYAAPELLAGADADARSDIYSLGVLLWELLVGRVPAFEELKSQRAPASAAPTAGIPADLDRAVARALEPDPAARFDCAADLAAALLQITRAADPKREITGLITTAYDVGLEHQRLTVDLAEARPLLDEGTAAPGPQRRPAGRSRALALLASCALAACAVLVALALRTHSDAPIASEHQVPPVAPLVQAPPTSPTEPPEPPAAPTGRPLPPTPPPQPNRGPHVVSHAKLPRTAARTPETHPPASPPAPAAGLLLDRARDSLHEAHFDEAARYATEALEAGNSRQKSAAHLILGKVYLFQAEKRQAAEEFASAVQLDPENTSASDHLAALRRKGGE